jgi:hypothetical protein
MLHSVKEGVRNVSKEDGISGMGQDTKMSRTMV